LIRRVAADSRAERGIDFLYGTPTSQASALFKAAGFSTVGTLQRFAFPLAGQRWYMDAAARVYHVMMLIRAWNRRAAAVEHAAHDFNADAFARPPGASSALRPFRPLELYRQCLAGYPSGGDRWFTFHENGCTTAPSGAALVRGGSDHVATLFSLSREPSLPLAAIVPALVTALRRAGYRRLWVSTVAGTHLADELKRAGFIPRSDHSPMMACALTELGADAIRAGATWEIARLDCDPYNP